MDILFLTNHSINSLTTMGQNNSSLKVDASLNKLISIRNQSRVKAEGGV